MAYFESVLRNGLVIMKCSWLSSEIIDHGHTYGILCFNVPLCFGKWKHPGIANNVPRGSSNFLDEKNTFFILLGANIGLFCEEM
jgi:hypothetical protein